VFPERLKQSKWKQEKRDLKEGDIVLRKDETAAGQTYKYAKAVKVHTSTDGKVRAADIEYKLPGESTFRKTRRPIHKLVLIIPIEEQASAAGKPGEAQPAPLTEKTPEDARTEPEAAGQEEAGVQEKDSPTEVVPYSPLSIRAPKPPIKIKKVISRKKAGKQARTIVVAAPKEEAEMVDIGIRPKKRGRPRKAANVGPLDPHKGSVLYPGKGNCTDPVNEDAILKVDGGGRPQSRNGERQLASDSGGDKT
jgi:hypothetical protein